MRVVNDMSISNVVTHPGVFHCDEVFSVAAEVIRNERFGLETRVFRGVPNEEVCNDPGVTVLDVGRGYNEELNNFDHHQVDDRLPVREVNQKVLSSYNEKKKKLIELNSGEVDQDVVEFLIGKEPQGIPMSSAGLWWKKYGVVICSGQADVADYVERILVRPIDATDNGLFSRSIYPVFSLAHQFSQFIDATDFDESFCKAVNYMIAILKRTIMEGEREADYIELMMNAEKRDQYLFLEQGMPIAKFHSTLKKRDDIEEVNFIVFPSVRSDGYMIITVPNFELDPTGMTPKVKFHEDLGGLRSEELAEIVELDSFDNEGTFVHKGRFIGGAPTIRDCIKLAEYK